MTNIELKEDSVIIDGIEYVKKDNQKEQVDPRHAGRYIVPDYQESLPWIKDVYPTREAAEKELAKRKAIVTILRYISDTYGIFEPDRCSLQEVKYYPVYIAGSLRKRSKGHSFTERFYSPIGYFSCGEHAEDIMKKFDKELRLIRDIK